MTTLDVKRPAEIYDEFFVPALFAQWAPTMLEAAGVRAGDRVLDVACGTGALTVAIPPRVGPEGEVVGLDANAEMLAVARAKAPGIEWLEAPAERLPLPDDDFDAVVSQFGLMFFDDRVAGLREMMRVLRPGGRMAVAVCDAIDRSPGYADLARLLDRLFGSAVGDALRAPFVLGDRDRLLALAAAAEISGSRVERHMGTVRFASIAALVDTERACAWTLGGLLDAGQFARLQREAQVALARYAPDGGEVALDLPALVLTARKPATE